MDSERNRLLRLLTEMAVPRERPRAAHALARSLGAEDLMIFVHDEALGTALPAPGFPQTVPGAQVWREFIALCRSRSGTLQRTVLPWRGLETRAAGIGDSGGNALVFLGGEPDGDGTKTMAALLPLLAAVFENERIQVVSRGNAAMAEQRAREAGLLAASLDKAREALRKALEEAREASRAKDRFLAALSHELRTPLTPVLLTAAAMEQDPRLPPAVRDDIAMIRRNVELEVELIDDLLDLSRIVTGKLHLRMENTDFGLAVQDAIDNCLPLFSAKGVALTQSYGGALPAISADPTRVRQVLWNLLRNAVKFTPPGGAVSVHTEPLKSGGVRAVVRDSGIGIATDQLTRIFSAFEQVHSGAAAEAGGLGLGLAISKAVVDMHGGSISASSAGAGTGTAFTVEFPPGTPEAAPPQLPRPGLPADNPVRARILMVEDSADTANALSRLLQRAGHEVAVCSGVRCALEILEHRSFDLLLSDIGLPDGSGCELMRTVRQTRGIPGIAVSGYGAEADIQQSREAGFAEHLVKPLRFYQVQEAIQTVLAPKSSA